MAFAGEVIPWRWPKESSRSILRARFVHQIFDRSFQNAHACSRFFPWLRIAKPVHSASYGSCHMTALQLRLRIWVDLGAYKHGVRQPIEHATLVEVRGSVSRTSVIRSSKVSHNYERRCALRGCTSGNFFTTKATSTRTHSSASCRTFSLESSA